MIAAVVLAAGASSRMGSPKALLRLGEKTLIEAHVASLLSVCHEVVVVVGAYRREIVELLDIDRVRIVVNEEWATSDALESLRLGVEVIERKTPVVVTPVDAPPVGLIDLRALIESGPPSVLSWDGCGGHPVIIGSLEVEHILRGGVVGGLRSLLLGAKHVPAITPDILCNLNTPELWKGYLSKLSSRK